jgi:hypothetical protein
MRHLLKITNIQKWLLEEVEKVLFNVHEERRRVAIDVCLFVTSGPGAKAPGCTAAITLIVRPLL